MTKYSKFNIAYHLQKWMDSVPGQTFLNYAYSWGASVVILGTLFKLTHLPGANLMLYIGMGTEVVVFFLSAFDRPFDKTAIGKDLPTHLEDEEEDEYPDDEEHDGATIGGTVITGGGVFSGGMAGAADGGVAGGAIGGGTVGGGIGGGTIIIGGSAGSMSAASGSSLSDDEGQMAGSVASGATGSGQMAGVVGNAAWVQQQQQVSPELEEATSNYVDELKRLTEMLGKVSEQSQRLTRDSEEMENLNRTLTGICKIYEMQLKGASAQVSTIDQINEQSRRMAEQIAELNRIYARMIEAMTVNMRAASPGNI